MTKDHKFWASFVLAIAAGLGCILLAGYLIERYTCTNYGAVTGRSVAYFAANGCFVHTEGGLIPVREYEHRSRRAAMRLVAP